MIGLHRVLPTLQKLSEAGSTFTFILLPPQGMNWDALLAKKLKPPFQPVIRAPQDVSNFDEEFTQLKPVLTLPRTPCPLTGEQQELFADFDFSAMS